MSLKFSAWLNKWFCTRAERHVSKCMWIIRCWQRKHLSISFYGDLKKKQSFWRQRYRKCSVSGVDLFPANAVLSRPVGFPLTEKVAFLWVSLLLACLRRDLQERLWLVEKYWTLNYDFVYTTTWSDALSLLHTDLY